jgi:hypothetical protein
MADRRLSREFQRLVVVAAAAWIRQPVPSVAPVVPVAERTTTATLASRLPAVPERRVRAMLAEARATVAVPRAAAVLEAPERRFRRRATGTAAAAEREFPPLFPAPRLGMPGAVAAVPVIREERERLVRAVPVSEVPVPLVRRPVQALPVRVPGAAGLAIATSELVLLVSVVPASSSFAICNRASAKR